MFEHILVPLDGSPLSALALPIADDLAQRYHSILTLLYVVPPMPIISGELAYNLFDSESILAAKTEGQRLLDEARTTLAAPDVRVLCLYNGEARIARTVVHVAEQQEIALIVMGSHGRSGLEHLFLGSVAEGVMRRAGVPVLIVRGKGAGTSAAKKDLPQGTSLPQSSA